MGGKQIKVEPSNLGYTTISGGQTKTLNLSSDMDNYSFLIAQGYTGSTMLAQMYIPIAYFKGGNAFRLSYADTSYVYWWDVTYSSDTAVKVHAFGGWPASTTLSFRILGIKETVDI